MISNVDNRCYGICWLQGQHASISGRHTAFEQKDMAVSVSKMNASFGVEVVENGKPRDLNEATSHLCH